MIRLCCNDASRQARRTKKNQRKKSLSFSSLRLLSRSSRCHRSTIASAGRASHGTFRSLRTRSSRFSFYFFYLVSKVNTYAAANVRVEQGQRVVDTGVYGLMRHPMYFGALFLIVGTPLALGSWWTLLLTPVFLLLLYFRIASEEKVLVRDLAGYAEYQRKVRYRLIPFVW